MLKYNIKEIHLQPAPRVEDNVPYQDFNIVISPQLQDRYVVAALAEEQSRVSATLPPPPPELRAQIARLAASGAEEHDETSLNQIGSALFRWLLPPPLESHLRIAWDRARRNSYGLRLRLSIDAPELAAWPWELLHDPVRGHPFAVSAETLLVRFFDQTSAFGGPGQHRATLPLNLLLVLPAAPELDLDREQRSVEAIAATMPDALRVRTLKGVITRQVLADALLMGAYDIVHFSGHGTFQDGRGYIALNTPEGDQDWVHSGALAQLAVNHGSIKLVVLNTCSSGQMDDNRAFQGLAPQMVRYGVPAVVAMQYPLTDEAANVFTREFYKRLVLGADAGRVDVAVTYARGMLSVILPHGRAWATPVLYTNAPDGRIYEIAAAPGQDDAEAAASGALDALMNSLRGSHASAEDWYLAGSEMLTLWRQKLHEAEDAYIARLADPRPEARQAALLGLSLTDQRIAALDEALAGEEVQP